MNLQPVGFAKSSPATGSTHLQVPVTPMTFLQQIILQSFNECHPEAKGKVTAVQIQSKDLDILKLKAGELAAEFVMYRTVLQRNLRADELVMQAMSPVRQVMPNPDPTMPGDFEYQKALKFLKQADKLAQIKSEIDAQKKRLCKEQLSNESDHPVDKAFRELKTRLEAESKIHAFQRS